MVEKAQFASQYLFRECKKCLPCGHICKGIAGESECLPCLNEECIRAANDALTFAETELCAVCYTSELGQ